MDFTIDKAKAPNKSNFSKSALDVSLGFSKDAYKEFGEALKGIILFGSVSRQLQRSEDSKGDVDLLIILDDITLNPNAEFIEAYKIIIQKLVLKHSKDIHVTTMRFTSFWDLARNGDPLVVNILRDGVALIDTGFFDPLQALLLRGQIRPTFESIWTYFNRAPNTLNTSRGHLVRAADDLYWAVIDSAHAALMKLGTVPPSPAHVADLMASKMQKNGLCAKTHVDTMTFFYKLHKEIEHRMISDVSGVDYEKYYSRATMFVEKMRTIISHD